jgi:hypothetical protein
MDYQVIGDVEEYPLASTRDLPAARNTLLAHMFGPVIENLLILGWAG